LEFTRLSQLTGDNKYYDAIHRVGELLKSTQHKTKLPGMWPTMMDFQNGNANVDNSFTLGALADSLYEYLPKMAALLGRVPESDNYEQMYRRSMDVVVQHLLFRPMLPDVNVGKDILFTGTAHVDDESGTSRLDSETQHLACFAGGMFALGGKLFKIDKHVEIGEKLARGCAWAYSSFPTGLMPEIMGLMECGSLTDCKWDQARWEQSDGAKLKLKPGIKHARDSRYILRPEAIESIFILYRITGQEDLRHLAWKMFESIMKATRTDLANSAIKDVTVEGKTEKEDSMEVSSVHN
jgi:mannosyl-oligosaccharide alpha-1,2-mannosidase